MVLKGLCCLLCITNAFVLQARVDQVRFDRSVFYSVLASPSIEQINKEIKSVQESDVEEKEAFVGALLMRKAGLVNFAKDKLKFFKSGHKKLETAILNDNKNPELRFLRLVIQEHAPGIVNYHANQQEDAQFVRAFFKDLPKVVRDAVLDYSKKSKIIQPTDF